MPVLPPFVREARHLAFGGVLALLAFTSPAYSQTGVYTLNGGTATTSAQTYAAATADESGVYVLNSGKLTLTSPVVTKTGNASNAATSSERGVNAGILAASAGAITITGGSVSTNATYSSGLFATGTRSLVSMSNGTITTTGNDSAGAEVTYGGEVVLADVDIKTTQSDSPALSMNFGGGTIIASGGTFAATGPQSSAIYSIGAVSVNNTALSAREGAAAVINGANSIVLTDCTTTGLLAGAEFEQTASSTGTGTFVANGGSLNALAGDLFAFSSASGAVTAAITLEGGAVVTTSTGNLVNATNDSTANFVADGETLAGNFITDSSSTIAATLQNSTALTGNINPDGTGTDSLVIDSTSTWKINGASILSQLTSAGTVAFATAGLTLDIDGNYSQASTGKLLVVLAGTAAGTNYDQLAATGTAQLAGTLEVNTASGFTPRIGATFNVVTYGSFSGAFATLTSKSGLTYTIKYGGTTATITITGNSAPSSAPTITSQPTPVKATPGADATFSVVATGTGTLSYHWYKDGSKIQHATSAAYTIANVTAADVGTYDVVVTDSVGSVTSSAAKLTIKITTKSVPTLTIAVDGDGEIVVGGEKGKALITRTGSTAAALTVYYNLKGTAVNGSDYVGTDGAALPGEVVIPAGSASVKLKFVATSGAKNYPTETVNVVLTASPNSDYTLGAAVKAKLQLIDDK